MLIDNRSLKSNASAMRFRRAVRVLLLIVSGIGGVALGRAQDGGPVGALRVRVIDQDWDTPLAGAMVHVPETGKKLISGEDGSVLFETMPAGSYTVVVSASGFERKVLSQIVVVQGEAKSEEVRLGGTFTDMEEFVIKDLDLAAGGGELVQLNVRSQGNTLLDNVGADMISRAGASTAAAALKMVTGATVQDGKYAVIRGLGDRYTSTLLNGVRLPNADRDKRAVHMDQFPSAMIESVQVSKTFLPDQQGDGTGGINIITKGIPNKRVLQASVSTEYDTNATGNDRFKTYHNGGNDFMGMRGFTDLDFWNSRSGDSPRGSEAQPPQKEGGKSDADKQYSTRVQDDAPPMNYGYKFAVGDFAELGDWTVGGMLLGSFSQKYKYRKGEQYFTTSTVKADEVAKDDNLTQSVENSSDEQLWSTGLALGAKNENNRIRFTGLYTHQSKDNVEIRNDGYKAVETKSVVTNYAGRPPRPTRVTTESGRDREVFMLSEYTESANGSLQLAGDHTLSALNNAILDWGVSYNMAESIEPDRRRVRGQYTYSRVDTENLTVTPSEMTTVEESTLHDIELERRWQETRESGWQGQSNYKQPYRLAEGWEGWFKGGVFGDFVSRTYRNRIYRINSSPIDVADEYDYNAIGGALDKLSLPEYVDQDSMQYDGTQDITAWYLMGRAPLPEWVDLVGGVRFESTLLETDVFPASGMVGDGKTIRLYRLIDQAYLDQHPGVPKDTLGLIASDNTDDLQAGNASIDQLDILPGMGLNFKLTEDVSLRFAYSETIARPTFKEITPIVYPDFDSTRVFLGNPNLEISRLYNYDSRLEWRPGQGLDLIAGSVFYKTIDDPIQYSIRRDTGTGPDYVYPENYGPAEIKGVELESRKGLEFISRQLKGFSVGGNLTLQDSEVEYRQDIREQLLKAGVKSRTRPLDGQSDLLGNLNLVFDSEATGLNFGLFYNLRGETYVAGDTATNLKYNPAIVENPVGTFDATIGWRFAKVWRVGLEFKNLLDPEIETVYRTPDKDIPRTSYKMGRIYGMSLGCSW